MVRHLSRSLCIGLGTTCGLAPHLCCCRRWYTVSYNGCTVWLSSWS
ncbi:hypothetical protein BU14_0091s0030 [Porphyra umbilicalis]|uniref:Uncharacterized protein n=1 Tax=Porphyra umbilicalis TaxID=2786 RepID=A0A1X6PE18_PORUM|nr:hypothetical protein BU14_0091s0030 [Porphyra umbilicalis]|eukprot:OSX79050.1 hypothetical protein BU14_0091s0030 [Porphyra umbilicalis]